MAGFYTIIAPDFIQTNQLYNVVVSVHNIDTICKMNLSLLGPELQLRKTVVCRPKTAVTVSFKIPYIQDGDYVLKADGVSGLIFTIATVIHFIEQIYIDIYIQTDKAKYKPGDLVQFRAIFLHYDLRPANPDEVSIIITDAGKNRIKWFRNVKLTKGVISEKLQLSEFPVLGTWSIEVYVGGHPSTLKEFDVEKYVLPKFQVKIDVPEKAVLSNEKFGFTLSALYTFGKGVNGKATIKIFSRGQERQYSGYVIEKELQKLFDLNGKAYVEFNINDIKPKSLVEPLKMESKITAIVEEEFTGNKQIAESMVEFIWDRYVISVPDMNIQNNMPNENFIYSVTISDLNNVPVTDDKHPVKLTINLYTIDSFLKDGIAQFKCSLQCAQKWNDFEIEYRGQKSKGIITKQKFENKRVEVLTKNIQIGNAIEIQFNSDKILSYLMYVIVGQDNIVHSGYTNLAGKNTKSYKWYMEATLAMVPTANIFVYYLNGKELEYYETTCVIEEEFLNKILIEAPKLVHPGEDVKIHVKTDHDSYVGLMAVDQSVELLKAGNDFDKEEIMDIFKNKYLYKTIRRFGLPKVPGCNSGLVTITNAYYKPPPISPFISNFRVGGCPIPPRIRKDFPECWFFEDFPSSGDGNLRITKKVPDTITSWVISGFSLNSKTGFALCEPRSKIESFRPFFVTTNLPYAVKRGEIVTIPVLVFNYFLQSLVVTVSFDNSDGEFKFIDEIVDQQNRIETITIASNSTELVNFVIRTERIGHITLKITAASHIAGDAIHKQLKVEPEGMTIFENRDYYMETLGGKMFSENLTLNIPKEVVVDSEHIEISLMGDILSSMVCNLDGLVRKPCGCGEQNMINFVPNILVLQYLESINKLTPSIKEKAKSYMEIGYQRELTYKHENGSYSAFGKSDRNGSTWLTAYVMRTFHQAAQYIYIDPEILIKGLDFLASIQSSNGNFPEYGNLFDFVYHNEVGVTAFVLLAFLENSEHLTKYKNVVDKGFRFLKMNVMTMNDLYDTSIALYALRYYKSDVSKIWAKLDAKARTHSGQKWWSKFASDCNKPSWGSDSNDVEINSYILMTLLDMNMPVVPIIKWLLTQRNSNGGFASTQDTVVGLQALAKFAEKYNMSGANLTIDFHSGDLNKSVYKSQIVSNKQNNLDVITQVLPGWIRDIVVTGRGSGTAILQISYRYNIALKDKNPSFNLDVKILPTSTLRNLKMEIHAEFKPEIRIDEPAQQNRSNMVVMEVSLPSGYTANIDSFDKIGHVNCVKRVETKNGETNIIIYLDSLEVGKIICVPLEADRTYDVSAQKPVPVLIYDYYDSLKRATTFYKI